jgi:hypothetical protein
MRLDQPKLFTTQFDHRTTESKEEIVRTYLHHADEHTGKFGTLPHEHAMNNGAHY